MKFLAAFAVLSFTGVSLAATVATVLSDLATISSQTTTLDNAIKAFPNAGGSLTSALSIHNDATNLVTSINQGTTDVQLSGTHAVPLPISESDGQSILSAVQGFEPTILDALMQVVTKKASFAALPIGGIPALVKQDLINLNASTFALEAALISTAPADLVPTATSIKSAIDAAFATAIAAYS